MGLDVDTRALKRRARQHWQAAGERSSPSDALILFYAAECALKAAALIRMSAQSTNALEKAGLRGHDLGVIAKSLNLPPHLAPPVHVRRRDGGNVPLREVHEAWRYGCHLESNAEEKAIASLEALLSWAKVELKW